MEEIFGSVKNLHIFIDDLIVSTDTLEQHNQALREILGIAQHYGITFNANKIDLYRKKLKILGHTITPGHVNVDESRYQPVAQMATPKNAKDVQRILGFFSYFRDHMPHLASIASPLYDITKPKNFKWQTIHSEAFDSLKQAFLNCKPLITPDFEQKFYLETDSSGEGWGAALLQENGVVAFASGTYNRHQYDYKATKSELLALRPACKKFHHYLAGRPFDWITDCKALVPLDSVRGDFFRIMAVWIEELLGNYEITAIHRAGSTITLPDTLSRHRIERIHHVVHNISVDLKLKDLSVPLKDLQKDCSIIGPIIQKMPFPISESHDAFTMNRNGREKILLPQQLWYQTIMQTHQLSIHPSKQLTHRILASHFWFPDMKRIIGSVLLECLTCQTCKTISLKNSIPIRRSSLKPDYPHQILAVDYIGPRKRHNNRWEDGFLLVVDTWSKKAYYHLLIGADTQEAIKGFKNILLQIPQIHRVMTCFSDCGSIFTSELWKEQLRSLNIHTLNAAPKHQDPMELWKDHGAQSRRYINSYKQITLH